MLQPTWSGTLGAPSQPSTTQASLSGETRTWTFGYDSNLAELTWMQDYRYLNTTFTQATGCIYGNSDNNYPTILARGITQILQQDKSGKSSATRTLSWVRSIPPNMPTCLSKSYTPPNWTVTVQDWWSTGQTNSSDRTLVSTYGTNWLDLFNGFITHQELQDGSSTEIASLDRVSNVTVFQDPSFAPGSGIPNATTNLLTTPGAGWNRSLSMPKSITAKRMNELTRKVDITYENIGLNPTDQLFSVTSGTSYTPYLDKSTPYNNKWPMLEGSQVSQVTETRYNASGVKYSQVMADIYDWDSPGVSLSLLQLLDNFKISTTGEEQGTSYTYTADGKVSTQTQFHVGGYAGNANASSLAITYDPNQGVTGTGKPVSWVTTYPNGDGTSGSLSRSQGNPDAGLNFQDVYDEKHVRTHTTYDLYGRPLTIQKDGEAPIGITYDPVNLTKTTVQSAKTTVEHYDAFGRLIETDLPDGRVIKPTYDLHSRVVSSQETSHGLSRTQTTEYDLLDRVTAKTAFDGVRTTFDYSTSGNNNVVTQTVWPLGLTTVTQKDPFDQVVSVQAPNGDLTTTTYDGWGHKTSVIITPAGGGAPQERDFWYDDLGRMTQKKEPETGTQLFQNFDVAGNAMLFTEGATGASPRIRTRVFDGLSRLRSQTRNGITETFSYIGPFLMGTTRAVNGDQVRQEFAYDGPGSRLSQETTSGAVTGTW